MAQNPQSQKLSKRPLSAVASKLKHNIDIYVPDEILKTYPDIENILVNSRVESEFEQPEVLANKNKFLFNSFGAVSLILIVIVLAITTIRLGLVSVNLIIPTWILWLGAILGITSFVIGYIAHQFHHKWLLNRFFTERIRQWKFQQFLDGTFIELGKTNPQEFEKELDKRWTSFKLNFALKDGALDDFVKVEDFRPFVKPTIATNDVMSQIFESYFELRLGYQTKYFSLKQNKLKNLDKHTSGIAYSSLIIAGILAVLELGILLMHNPMLEETLGWIIGVSAIIAALISAAVRVFRSATAISEETERYISKWTLLKILGERFQNNKATSEDKLNVMVETERICEEELREFIRVFKKADYLL